MTRDGLNGGTPDIDPYDELPSEETGLVAATLMGSAAIVGEHVRLEWFRNARLARIVERALEIHSRGEECDLSSVGLSLPRDLMLLATSCLSGPIPAPSNIPNVTRGLEHAWRLRRSKQIVLEMSAPDLEPDRMRDLSSQLVTLQDEGDGLHSRMADHAINGLELMQRDLPPLESFLGNGLMVRDGLSILVGHSGLGKTFLALQLMRSLAEGSKFLDSYYTRPTGTRVGFLELEMPDVSIKQRLSPIRGPWLERTSILCMPGWPVDIVERDTQDEIIRWCRREKIEVLIMDPMNDFHNLDENKGVDMGVLMKALHRIRVRAGVSILILHHVTKTDSKEFKQSELTPRTTVMQMVRGSGKLNNAPDTVIGLLEAPGGRVRLVWAKTRHAQGISEEYLVRDQDGYFRIGESIQASVSNESEEKIEKSLLLRGPSTVAELAASTGLSDQTVRDRLKSMSDRVHSLGGKPQRYATGYANPGVPDMDPRDTANSYEATEW